MHTLFYTHPACLEHDMGAGHPEQPDRLRAVYAALDQEAFALIERRDAPAADDRALERVHKAFYVESVFEKVPASGHRSLDPDTALCPASGEAARRAAGAVCAAVDAVVTGAAVNAFCAVRPPGHHAEADQAMGFCLFNNVAIAAEHARARHGLDKVAVVDFDVHHGNGTQYHFENRPCFFYASSHQWPAYPGTGLETETGVDNNVCNVRLRPGTKGDEFREAYTGTILPRLRAFAPELLIVSAGFDAHARDPLAQLRLVEDDFAWVSRELVAVAAECCGGRLVSALEGGYDLAALKGSVTAHLRELMAA